VDEQGRLGEIGELVLVQTRVVPSTEAFRRAEAVEGVRLQPRACLADTDRSARTSSR